MNHDFYESPYRPKEEPIPATEFKVEDMGPAPEEPKKKKRSWPKVVALCLVCALLGTTGGAAVATALVEKPDRAENMTTIYESDRVPTVVGVTHTNTGKQLTLEEVYASWVNSTVGITTSINTNFWGYQTTSAASGSGFIFSHDGYILTNFHVVEDSNSITVSMYNGKTYDAELVGYDEGNDVAVLKIQAENLVPVVMGNSDSTNVGDSVIAIGNPLGELTFSLTSGTISAKDRDITMSNGSTMRLMQTDCAINSGNSGGALFNLYGEVIGITNAKYSSSSASEASIDNIGFAIPINKARSIAQSIIEKGYVSKPYIGVSVTTVSAETQSYGLPQGAAVKSIDENGPAASAGLKVNDIITHINGKEITSHSDLVSAVSNCAVGDVLKLTVYRKGNTDEITITVGEKIQSTQQQASRTPQNSWSFGE